jgi:hypothetical protein
MAHRSPDRGAVSAQGSGHELAALSRDARFPRGKPSARSRSVPTSRRNSRDKNSSENSDETIQGSSIGLHNHDEASRKSVTRSQLDGIEEHIKDGGVGVEELRKKPDGKEDIENRFAIPVMPHQDSDYTLSEERSRRRIDSDRVSETDTIVPRRNLSILDVAALILNKMVIFSWTYTILGIA